MAQRGGASLAWFRALPSPLLNTRRPPTEHFSISHQRQPAPATSFPYSQACFLAPVDTRHIITWFAQARVGNGYLRYLDASYKPVKSRLDPPRRPVSHGVLRQHHPPLNHLHLLHPHPHPHPHLRLRLPVRRRLCASCTTLRQPNPALFTSSHVVRMQANCGRYCTPRRPQTNKIRHHSNNPPHVVKSED